MLEMKSNCLQYGIPMDVRDTLGRSVMKIEAFSYLIFSLINSQEPVPDYTDVILRDELIILKKVPKETEKRVIFYVNRSFI